MAFSKEGFIDSGSSGSASYIGLKTNQATITNDTTINDVNQIYIIKSTTGNIDITLPASANSGDQIIFHHEEFANNVVSIKKVNFPSANFEIKNFEQAIKCVFTTPALPDVPHWLISASPIDAAGNLALQFRKQVFQFVNSPQLYLSNNTLLTGKTLSDNLNNISAGSDLLSYKFATSPSDIIQKFYTDSLNITELKKGKYRCIIFAKGIDTTVPIPNDATILIDINVVDVNGNVTQNLLNNVSENSSETLNATLKSFIFEEQPNVDATINLTDRLELVVKVDSKSQDIDVQIEYNGFQDKPADLQIPIEKKQDLDSAKLFVGDSNNKAVARTITGEVSINNIGVAQVNTNIKTPVGTIIECYNNIPILPEFYVICNQATSLSYASGSPFEPLFNLAQQKGLLTTNANEKGKFLLDTNTNSFYTPDLRGYFLRMLGGIDPDINRLLGSIQLQSYLDHNHSIALDTTGGYVVNNARSYFGNGAGASQAGTFSDREGVQIQSTFIGKSGGNETRPSNVAVNFYIKY